jgi:hypothetical protein
LTTKKGQPTAAASPPFGQKKMDQPTPKVTEKDVERIVLRDFGAERLRQVLDIVHTYGKQEWNKPGSPRVWLAILKLADGNLDRLTQYTEIAIKDFRDVVSMAEYPEYFKIGFDKVHRKAEKAAIEADWKQYQEWLEKTKAEPTDAAAASLGQ